MILPDITHWQSPGFHAYFPSNVSGPAILGELLSAGLGVQGMLWSTSPACTEVETRVLDMLADLLVLPEAFRSNSTGGDVIQRSASDAVLCALVAARERDSGLRTNRLGCDRSQVAYCSTETHSYAVPTPTHKQFVLHIPRPKSHARRDQAIGAAGSQAGEMESRTACPASMVQGTS